MGDEFLIALPKDDLRISGAIDEETDELVEEEQTAIVGLDDPRRRRFSVVLPRSEDDLADLVES